MGSPPQVVPPFCSLLLSSGICFSEFKLFGTLLLLGASIAAPIILEKLDVLRKKRRIMRYKEKD